MPQDTEKMPKRNPAKLKAAVLVLFILAAIALVRFSPLKDHLTVESLGLLLDRAGFWAPLVFVFIYAAGVCLFIPGTLLTAIGAALFGPYLGFVCVWLGAMLGASGAFLIGRGLGRQFAASIIGDRLKRYDESIASNGFATVLYLRLVYFPFTPMNFGMGLTRVRFWDYFWGTGIGILVGTFVFTFFIGTLKEIWATGQWERLLSFRAGFALAVFIASFFIPGLVEKVKKQFNREDFSSNP